MPARIWLEDPGAMVRECHLIPKNGQPIESQLNAITRLVVIIAIILLLLGYRHGWLFLLLSLVVIILLYYLQKGIMERLTKEDYADGNAASTATAYYAKPTNPRNYSREGRTHQALPPTYGDVSHDTKRQQVYDAMYHHPDESNQSTFVSPSQLHQAGRQNVKTFDPPVIGAPIASSFWRDGAENVASLNVETPHHAAQSGYHVSSVPRPPAQEPSGIVGTSNRFSPRAGISESYGVPDRRSGRAYSPVESKPVKENFTHVPTGCRTYAYDRRTTRPINLNTPDGIPPSELNHHNGSAIEANKPIIQAPYYNNPAVEERWSAGKVLKTSGYDPSQVSYGGMSNYLPPTGLEHDVNRNLNLSTQSLQPGNYLKSDIIEPVNGNLGISFAPGERNLGTVHGDRTHSRHVTFNLDPAVSGWVEKPFAYPTQHGPQDVYDARALGGPTPNYSSNRRRYIDSMGRPAWTYEDINSARLPNLVGRNTLPVGVGDVQYGTMREEAPHGLTAREVRCQAHEAYVKGMNQRSNDIGDSFALKRAGRMAQLREFPIRTM